MRIAFRGEASTYLHVESQGRAMVKYTYSRHFFICARGRDCIR